MNNSILPLFVLFFAIIGLLAGVAWWMFHQVQQKRRKQSLSQVTLHIRIPKEDENRIDDAEQMFGALHGLSDESGWELLSSPDSISLEIVAGFESIQFYVSVQDQYRDFVEKQIHSAYPGADILEVDEPNIFSLGGKIAYTALKFTGKKLLPGWPWLSSESHLHSKTHWHNPTNPANATLEGGRKLAISDLWQVAMCILALVLLMQA